MNKQVLLIIDPQKDFCSPLGSLYVPNAEKDIQTLAKWIDKKESFFDHIVVSLDWHPFYHIAHPGFWKKASGETPSPFTQILSEQVKNKEFIPISAPIDEVVKYLEHLEQTSNFKHLIWPVHCVMGSEGACIDDQLMSALIHWGRREAKNFQIEMKGTNPMCEHFGIFEAQIPIQYAPETQTNTRLLEQLDDYGTIYLAGEAKSHCVANSLEQMLKHRPALAKKIIILEDCMSDVTGLGHLGTPIYAKAREMGVQFRCSMDLV